MPAATEKQRAAPGKGAVSAANAKAKRSAKCKAEREAAQQTLEMVKIIERVRHFPEAHREQQQQREARQAEAALAAAAATQCRAEEACLHFTMSIIPAPPPI